MRESGAGAVAASVPAAGEPHGDDPTRDAAWRLQALTEIARVVARTRGHDTVVTEAARAARRALRASAVSLSVWERDLGQLRTILNDGDLAAWEQERPHDEVYAVHHTPELAATLLHGQGYVLSSGEDSGTRTHALLHELGKGSGLNLPIVLEGQVWGTLWASRRTDEAPYRESDLDYGLLVASLVSAALAAAERIAQASRSAFTDPLTGLANRRAVDQRLDRALGVAGGGTVSLVVCDVTGLRQLNDTQGQDAGDLALVQLAGALSAAAALAPGSLAARLGGDEFAVVVDGHPAEDAVRVADEVCRWADQLLPLRVSCGVASVVHDQGQEESAARLVRLAEAAQQRARRLGSRRAVVAGRALDLEPGPLPSGSVSATGSGVATLLVEAFAVLDTLRSSDAQNRLAAVSDALGRHLAAAGWWVSTSPAGEPVVRTVDLDLYRTVPSAGTAAERPSGLGTEYALADYPLTAAAVDGDAFHVAVADPRADPAEVTFLESVGGVALLVAGGRQADGTGWLVEVMADEISRPMQPAVAAARALVAAALAPGADGRPHRPG